MQNMRELMKWEKRITGFVCLFKKGMVKIPDPVIEYFDVPGVKLCVKVQKEILLACEPTKTSIPTKLEKGKLCFPEAAIAKLGISDGDYVAMIERKNAFAFKKIPTGVLKEFDKVPKKSDKPIQVKPLIKLKAKPKKKKTEKSKPAPRREMESVIVTVEPLRNGNKINLQKQLRSEIGKGTVYWDCGDEIILTAMKSDLPAEIKGPGVVIPENVLKKLKLTPGDNTAFIQRPNGFAVKKIELKIREGKRANAFDKETPYAITRTIETNPQPDQLLPDLAKGCARKRLKYSIKQFLEGKQSFNAWKCRELLGLSDGNDKKLQKKLAEERFNTQQKDGSWDSETMATARCLRELAELGYRKDERVKKGAEWLLKREESKANPGMFFLSDRLVARQAEILEKRKTSKSLGSLRFAGRTPSEAKKVIAGDDLIEKSCGTRIMWPNALCLEVLLMLGYEKHPRIERALKSLMHGYTYWCECNYQIGTGTHVWREIPGKKEMASREEDCMDQYRYGGVSSTERLLEMRRMGHSSTNGKTVTYPLEMREHIQPCEVITARALCHAKNPMLFQAASAHMWRFASVQHGGDGSFRQGDYNPTQPHMLQVLSCFDHPASKVVIMRSIPWIIKNQNPDGSWGSEDRKEASSLAIIRALLRVRDLLPENALGLKG